MNLEVTSYSAEWIARRCKSTKKARNDQLHLFDEPRGAGDSFRLHHKDSDHEVSGRKPRRVAQMCVEACPVR